MHIKSLARLAACATAFIVAAAAMAPAMAQEPEPTPPVPPEATEGLDGLEGLYGLALSLQEAETASDPVAEPEPVAAAPASAVEQPADIPAESSPVTTAPPSSSPAESGAPVVAAATGLPSTGSAQQGLRFGRWEYAVALAIAGLSCVALAAGARRPRSQFRER